VRIFPPAALASVTASVCLAPSVAWAHTAIKGIGGFYNGLLHPFVVPAHLLSLLAIALLMGQQDRETAGRNFVGFALAFPAGLIIANLGVKLPFEYLPMAVAAVLGLAVAAKPPIPAFFIYIAAMATAFVVGWDSPTDEPGIPAASLFGFGVTLGAFYIVIMVTALTLARKRPWQGIAVRVAGSWIAASSVMILALATTGSGL
jgi:urease accessory protein